MGVDGSTNDSSGDGVRSTVHILGHPVHPMLIPFPLAFLVGAAVTDVVYLGSNDTFWATASMWLLVAGLLTGIVAALAGLVDFLTIERARRHLAGWVHLYGNLLVIVLALINWIPRIDDPAAFVVPWGVTLSVVTAALLGVTGWTGGELSYRHRVGVYGP